MDTTMERLDDSIDLTMDLVELGEVSQDTRGFLLGIFADPGFGRRLLPI